MDEQALAPVRPYFVPEDVDFDSLPTAVKAAFETIVAPSYAELVLAAKTALERSAGATLTFLLSLEVLEHFELGRNLNMTGQPTEQAAADREKMMLAHLRLVSTKQQAANFLMRLRSLRAKHDVASFHNLVI